jgi:hypothetical protein
LQADADDDEANPNMLADGPAVAQLAAAKGKLLTKVSKKHMVDIVVPILVQLKIMLEKNKSPLLRQLMVLLVDVMKQYKKEVRDTLAYDPVLLNELDFDTRAFEVKAKEKKERAEKDKLERLRARIAGGGEEDWEGGQGGGEGGEENNQSLANALRRGGAGEEGAKVKTRRVAGALGGLA